MGVLALTGASPIGRRPIGVVIAPTLGTYPATSTFLSANTTVIPSAAPTNATSMIVSASTNFKGELQANPATGVVRVTNAHPAGIYPVMVKAFNSSGESVSTTFNLTVTTPVTCNPVAFAAPNNINVGGNPESVAVGDFNGDGKQDLAVPIANTNSVLILLGDGAGSFSAGSNFRVGSLPVFVVVNDFNGDGKQDLATANTNSHNVSILLGNGAGSFSTASNFAADTYPQSVAVGDFNRDGKPDLAVASQSDNVSILLGSGNGSFGAPTQFYANGSPRIVAVGDFNEDGKQDLAVSEKFNSNPDIPPGHVSILFGDGMGSFSAPTNFDVANNAASLAVGDFNGDGKQDLAVATTNLHLNDNVVSILLGNGMGSFGAATNFGGVHFPNSIVAGDFNGDGNQDLAVANSSTPNVSILLGDGAGSFSAATNFAVGRPPWGVVVGDFNGDARQDLVTANLVDVASVSVLLGSCATADCTVCHKRTTTITLPCNSLEYRRHLDHGDTPGACPSN